MSVRERRHNQFALRWRDVDLARGTITVRAYKTDAGERTVYVLPVRKQDAERLPEGLTPHSLRRTFASLLFAIGEPHAYVMDQTGHTTASLALAICARVWDRRDGEKERQKALVTGEDWTLQRATGAADGNQAGTRAKLTAHAVRS